MTLVSSFRPHVNSQVYRENQIRALNSWEPVVDRIAYFGDFEPELARPKVVFVNSENWPPIYKMAQYCAEIDRVAAIINSDIVLDPAITRIWEIIKNTSIGAATSRRFDLETGKLNPLDKGRDIFVAKSKVWRRFAQEVPEELRMGHQIWDGWAVGFFRKLLETKFAEFTQTKTVFHPEHGERLMPYSAQIGISGPYYGYWSGVLDTQIV